MKDRDIGNYTARSLVDGGESIAENSQPTAIIAPIRVARPRARSSLAKPDRPPKNSSRKKSALAKIFRTPKIFCLPQVKGAASGPALGQPRALRAVVPSEMPPVLRE